MHLVEWLNKQSNGHDMAETSGERRDSRESVGWQWVRSPSQGREYISTVTVQLSTSVGNTRVWLSAYSHSKSGYKICMLAEKHGMSLGLGI